MKTIVLAFMLLAVVAYSEGNVFLKCLEESGLKQEDVTAEGKEDEKKCMMGCIALECIPDMSEEGCEMTTKHLTQEGIECVTEAKEEITDKCELGEKVAECMKK